MNNYKLTIKDGIITDIEMFKVLEQTDENTLPDYEEIKACLYIPKEVVGFSDDPEFLESLIGFNPETIEVEEGNEVYEAYNNCLIRKADKTMIMGCSNSYLDDSSHIEHIGPCALCAPLTLDEMDLENLQIPEGIKSIGYRAFANQSEEHISIIVPDSVEKVGCMAFMMSAGSPEDDKKCTITFYGSPELEIGVFGTKAESEDSDFGIYKELPETIYQNPKKLVVRGLKNSSVEEYCKKYGITFEVIKEYYEDVVKAILGSRDAEIIFADEFYSAFDEVMNTISESEQKLIKDIYLKKKWAKLLRRLRNPVRSRKLRKFINNDSMEG